MMNTKDFKAIKFTSLDGIDHTIIVKAVNFDKFMNAATRMKAFQVKEVEVTEEMLKGSTIYTRKI